MLTYKAKKKKKKKNVCFLLVARKRKCKMYIRNLTKEKPSKISNITIAVSPFLSGG